MQDNPRSNDQRTTAVLSQQHDLALIEVDTVLGRFGYGLADFGLPLPASTSAAKQASKELKRELEFNRDYETARAETQRAMMRQNPGQAAAYDTIVDHVLPEGSWPAQVRRRMRPSLPRVSGHHVRRSPRSSRVACGGSCESRRVPTPAGHAK